MIKKLLNTQTKSVTIASIILAVFYVISAGLGLLRDHFLAGRIGTEKLDIYYAAFTIPDLIGLLMIFGAISAAIIPIFTDYLEKSEDQAWEYASVLLNVFLTCLMLVCGAFILLAPFLVKFITPGFSPEKQAATVSLMRLMFLSPIILGISNIVSGILQVFHRFLVTALAPVMYNLGIIIGIIFLVPWLGLTGLALGVIIGGLLHLAIQLPVFFHLGFKYRPLFNVSHQGVLKTLKLMVPRSLGLGAGQINTIATTTIASTLIAGSIGVFTLANNLSNMLISMLAVSLSTAIFPSLSRSYAKENQSEFSRKFSSAFLQLLFLSLPASIALFFLRAQIVRVVLGNGQFNWIDTRLTAACLGIFAMGICFQGLIFLLSKTFYAEHNTKIPAIFSVLTVALNVALSLFLVWQLNARGIFYSVMQAWLKLQGIESISVIGLALSFSIAGLFEALFLVYFAYKYYKVFDWRLVLYSLYKMILSGMVMAAVIVIVRQSLVIFNIVALQTFWGVFWQLVLPAIAGGVAYFAFSAIVKSPELKFIKSFFLKTL